MFLGLLGELLLGLAKRFFEGLSGNVSLLLCCLQLLEFNDAFLKSTFKVALTLTERFFNFTLLC
jgi:hypothetical protein